MYRYVPQRWRFVAQLATLLGTALLGLSIALTPANKDPKLSVIEHAMDADVWAYLLLAFGLTGFVAEIYASTRNKSNLFLLVSICHIACLSLILSYGVAATVGLIRLGFWYNFGGPVLCCLLAIWHYIYIKRRPNKEISIIDGIRK